MLKSNLLQNLPEQFFATLFQKINAKLAAGADLINLASGNPDQPTPANIVSALQRAAAQTNNHGYCVPFSGKLAFKQAVAEFYQREYGVALDPATEVAMLFGSKTGLVELPLCILNPNDYLLLPDPGYPDYLSSVALANIHYLTIPLLQENAFLPDYTSLSAAELAKIKLIYLNYPNNPTGATANLAFFEQTVAWAKQHDILIAHDFAYGAIGYQQKPISFLAAKGSKDVGIEFYTLSKTYNMAGWRVAFAVGNAEIISALNLFQEHIFVGLFPALQDAAIEALLGPQQSVVELVQLYQQRLTAFLTKAKQIGWSACRCEGTFFVWMKVPAGYSNAQFCNLLLDKANVVVANGEGFGTQGKGFVRISLLNPANKIIEALTRIGKLAIF